MTWRTAGPPLLQRISHTVLARIVDSASWCGHRHRGRGGSRGAWLPRRAEPSRDLDLPGSVPIYVFEPVWWVPSARSVVIGSRSKRGRKQGDCTHRLSATHQLAVSSACAVT